jgi:ArsR family metal-binding transcriptional regulator
MLRESLSFRLVNIFCLPSSTLFNALVEIPEDISKVLPYLNATVPGSHYSHEAKTIDFMHSGHIVTLLPGQMKVTGVADHREAEVVIEELRQLIRETWARRASLAPREDNRRQLSAVEVLRYLPMTNCGRCESRTCLAYALALTRGTTSIDECLPLHDEEQAEKLRGLEDLLR